MIAAKGTIMKSLASAWLHHEVLTPVDAGHPVGLQLDSYHLDSLGSKVHFGGRLVAMYGYADREAYLVDTDQQGGAVSTSLARERTPRHPCPLLQRGGQRRYAPQSRAAREPDSAERTAGATR